jgi:peptide chain release factor subunit 1
MKEKAKRKLRKLLKELEKIKGRHTELVSLYIPAGSNLVDAITQVRSEQSTAQNIKAKQVRKNVVGALEKILQHLKTFKKVPANGLVIFCGNVSPIEGQSDIRIWSIEPPEKLTTKIYWCDQKFVLEPLFEMVAEKDVYGLIVLDTKEATIGLLKGKKIEVLKHLESIVPGKTSKGGFSQQRYQRIREGLLHDFLKKVGETSSKLFLKEERLKGVIIGGPGPVKERFFDEKHLHYKIQQKVIGVKDVSYSNEHGLEELVRRSADLLRELEIMREKDILNKFFFELGKDGLVVYGLEKTIKALELGTLDTLIIHEDFEIYEVKFKCQCGYTEEKNLRVEEIEKQKCKNCGAALQVVSKKDLSDILEERAKKFGTKIFFVSNETQEGREFFNFGIGGLLRYKV